MKKPPSYCSSESPVKGLGCFYEESASGYFVQAKIFFFLLILSAILLFPAIADSCPLCQGGATKKTTSAYEGITLLLGLMPIVGGMGIFYWIHRKSKQAKGNKS